MRPLSQPRSTQGPSTRRPLIHRRPACTIFLLAFALSLTACASGPGGSSTTPPTPQITVTIAPNSGTVLLGNTLTFSATITNTSDTSVFWSINGISGGSPQVGTISADGIYTAPADLPPGNKVQVTATSHADSSKSSIAGVSVSSDIAVSLPPVPSSVELGALKSSPPSIASSGKPDPAIRWTLSGPACPNNCGAIDANGNYTALAILPSAPSVIAFRWSTLLGTNPKTILTQNQTVTGSLNEIELVIQQSLGVWSSVSGTALTPSSIAPLVRGSANNLCASDGINSISFHHPLLPF